MRDSVLLLLLISFGFNLPAQSQVLLGGGNSEGITVTSSSAHLEKGWEAVAGPEQTINGAGLDSRRMDASRFLAQATLGANRRLIDEVAQMHFEDWIDQQFEIEPTSYHETLLNIYTEIFLIYIDNGNDPNHFRCRPKWYQSNYAWWQMIITGEDLLRQRVALALSEILVVSKRSALEDYGWAIASYYDIFVNNAFGNYQDILTEVSFHPAMGNYLSHLNNPKSNPAENAFPDENYARELMQLFSLGVHKLNQDGSVQVDDDGAPIPAYDNVAVDGLAKVFTGLGAGEVSECGNVFAPAFGLNIKNIDMTVPMQMYEEWHEQGPKTLFDDIVIPGDQTGLQDIEQAIDHIFAHPNVGPFLAQRLIQRLVKSNPSPEYIFRVAEAFNDNGAGVRGDMQAIIKAILLDPEARDCAPMQLEENGRLREPILRYTHFARAMDKFPVEGRYWETGAPMLEATGQHPMHAPSVFNFFQSDFAPQGPIAEAELVAPEYQILNSVTSTEYFNLVDDWAVHEELFYHWESVPSSEKTTYIDVHYLLNFARDPEVLMNELDLILTHGQLTDRTRTLLRTVLNNYEEEGIDLLIERTLLALYFLMVCPDYVVIK